MEIQEEKILLQWGITEWEDARIKGAIRLMYWVIISFLVIALLLNGLGLLGVITATLLEVALVLGWNSMIYRSKPLRDPVIEAYAFTEEGILVNNLKENKENFYPWPEFTHFYSLRTALPILDATILKMGERVVLVKKDNQTLVLKTSMEVAPKVGGMLIERLPFKMPGGAQYPVRKPEDKVQR